MSKFKFTGTEERYFPSLTLLAQPGDIIEAEENPDGNWWSQVSDKRKPTTDVAVDETMKEEG